MDKNLTIYEVIDKHLERGYRRSAGRMLLQIKSLSTNPGSDMVIALNSLDQEVQGLTESGQPIQSTTKSYQKALNALGALFAVTGTLIGRNSPAVQQSGIDVAPMSVTSRVFINLTEEIIAKGVDPLSAKAFARYRTAIQNAGGQFRIPSSKFLSTYKAMSFLNKPEWKAKMERWGSGYYAKTKGIFKNGMAKGWSPKYTAEKIREVATNIPYSAAENLTRTLQLNAYRQASLEVERMNGNFITGKIRIATLDQRTCLSCIALHGTPVPLGEAVEDHYRGRCTEFYQVPGGDEFPPMMQSDSTPGNRKFVPFKTGEEWFASLPPERQALQRSFLNSPAKLKAYKDGLSLSDFVGDHVDDVFGNQKIELSLLKILGTSAGQYYAEK